LPGLPPAEAITMRQRHEVKRGDRLTGGDFPGALAPSPRDAVKKGVFVVADGGPVAIKRADPAVRPGDSIAAVEQRMRACAKSLADVAVLLKKPH
jgi:hypothetical protein